MYSPESIATLKARIGFGSDLTVPVTVSEDHRTGTSGRLFSFFHKLVNLSNLYATVPEINMPESDFNAYLEQLKYDAAKGALVKLLNLNNEYRNDFDYSGTIIERPEIFEDVYGYTLAINAIEQMVSTQRTNDAERNANLAYNKLKMELEGITDNEGRILAKGLHRALELSIRKATDILFPSKGLEINNANFW